MSRARWIRHYLFTRGRSYRYGPDRSQVGDLHVPSSDGPHPVIVLIHGGSWQKRYGRAVMRALAADLMRRGWAVWNIEYRRLGDGGGWPETFEDVAAAIDHLAVLQDARLDLERVSILGHSAGGHLALWAAGRSKLLAGALGAFVAPPCVRLRRVVSLAGVADLTRAYRAWDGGAAQALMGGSPDEVPDRYAIGDPMRLVPLEMAVLIVHGVCDETVSIELSRGYARESNAAGGRVELVELEGEAGRRHRVHLDPRSDSWAAVVRWLEKEGLP